MSDVSFVKIDSTKTDLSDVPIKDGQLIFETDSSISAINNICLDEGTVRMKLAEAPAISYKTQITSVQCSSVSTTFDGAIVPEVWLTYDPKSCIGRLSGSIHIYFQDPRTNNKKSFSDIGISTNYETAVSMGRSYYEATIQLSLSTTSTSLSDILSKFLSSSEGLGTNYATIALVTYYTNSSDNNITNTTKQVPVQTRVYVNGTVGAEPAELLTNFFIQLTLPIDDNNSQIYTESILNFELYYDMSNV